MDLERYRSFTHQLRARLESDGRVLGLVALGSMAELGRTPDVWSDHDFFVITVAGVQESFRQDLGWLPAQRAHRPEGARDGAWAQGVP